MTRRTENSVAKLRGEIQTRHSPVAASVTLNIGPAALDMLDDLRTRFGLESHGQVLDVALAALAAIGVGDGDVFWILRDKQFLSCTLPIERAK